MSCKVSQAVDRLGACTFIVISRGEETPGKLNNASHAGTDWMTFLRVQSRLPKWRV